MILANDLRVEYVIISHPRTGSTLLQLALRQHPHVCQFGELFNDEKTARVIAASCGRGNCWLPAPYIDVNVSAEEYVRRQVFKPAPWPDVRAVGFKLFYHQAHETEATKTLWRFLRTEKQIRILHVYRYHLLECLVSLQTAFATDVWAVSADDAQPARPTCATFYLSPAQCKDYFCTIVRQRKIMDRIFSEHNVLQIEYSRDLTERFHVTTTQVQRFLKVPFHPLEKSLRKQANTPIKDRIENFEQLKRYFSYTKYSCYFE